MNSVIEVSAVNTVNTQQIPVETIVANNNVDGDNNIVTVAKAVVVTSVVQVEAMTMRIAVLSAEAKDFELGAYATANQVLYGLIQKSYTLYKDLTNTGDSMLRLKKQALIDYLNANGLGKYVEKPLSQRIIVAVFGDRDLNRRRVSSYHVALRALIAQGVAVDDVEATIQQKGGVQEMSAARAAGTLGVAEKVKAVEDAVKSATLATVSSEQIKQFANNEKVGEQFTAVLTQEADGSFSINTIVDNKAALKAVMAAHYNIEKAKTKKA
jgi:hypothetical protein